MFLKLVSNISYVDNENIVWFIGSYYNALFHLDLNTMECRLFAEFIYDQRVTIYKYFSCCLKYINNIFIFPYFSDESIRVIDIESKNIKRIEIDNVNKQVIGIARVYQEGTRLYAVALGLNEILEIDGINFKLLNRYPFQEVSKSMYGNCYFHEKKIYIFWEYTNRIIEFDLVTKNIKEYNVPIIENGVYTFGFVGDKACLASKEKRLYLWDMEKNEIVCIKKFPNGFGYYMRENDDKYYLDTKYNMGVSFDCIEIYNKTWLIPHEGNFIMWMSLENVDLLSIFENEENYVFQADYFLKSKQYAIKYCTMYTRDNRYIGFYSFLSNSFYEIDSRENTIKKLNIKIEKKSDKIINDRCYLFSLSNRIEKEKEDLNLMLSVEIDEYYARLKELERYNMPINKMYAVGLDIFNLMISKI